MTDDRPASPHAVHLWLTVTDHGEFYPSGKGTLWHKWLVMGHTPAEGDMIELWDFGDDGSVTWTVRRRYWNADGTLGLDLTAMVVDPPEGQHVSSSNPNYASRWWTDQDGDPAPKLAASGWVRRGRPLEQR